MDPPGGTVAGPFPLAWRLPRETTMTSTYILNRDGGVQSPADIL